MVTVKIVNRKKYYYIKEKCIKILDNTEDLTTLKSMVQESH